MNNDNSDTPLLGGLADPSRGVNAQALLHEIVSLLKGLLERDEPAHIDLRALPLTHQDYTMLQETLGEGEISAEVRNLGVTLIRESGVAGVWWVTHYNEEEDVIGEFLEIAFCPEGLIAELESVEEGVAALQARLVELEYLSKKGRPR
ncbi:MAG TPA: hydrogenase expression/formation C-terminal domain-containing protein [Gammaproteobacteria bacterium]